MTNKLRRALRAAFGCSLMLGVPLAGCGPQDSSGVDATTFGVFTPGTTNTVVAGATTTTIIEGLTVTPSRLDFGSSDNQLSFVVVNKTGLDIGFEIIGGEEWVHVDPRVAVVANGGSVTVTVQIFRVLLLTGEGATNLAIRIPDQEGTVIPITVGGAPDSPDVPDGTNGADGPNNGGPSNPNPTAPASLTVNVGSLDFGNGAGTLPVMVSNSGGGALNFSSSSTASWLTIANGSGSNVASGEYRPVRVSVERRDLPVGDYSAAVQITGANRTQTVNVAMRVETATSSNLSQPQLFVGQTLLDYDTSVTRQQAYIRKDGAGNLAYTISPSAAWIIASTSGGVSRGFGHKITVMVDRTGMSAGEYWGSVDIVAENGQRRSLVVRMVVPTGTPAPSLYTSSSVDLGNAATSGLVQIRSRPVGTTLQFRAYVSESWMSLAQDSGEASAATGSVTVNVDRSQLSAGDHDGYVTVVSPDGQVRDVHIHVFVSSPGNDGTRTPPPWGNTDQRLDVIAYLEPGAVGGIYPLSNGFDPSWWATPDFAHVLRDSYPSANSPKYLRQTVDALLAQNPDCVVGSYVSGMDCRKWSDIQKFSPESIPYACVPPEYFLTDYDDVKHRVTIDLAQLQARRLLADLLAQEAIGRGVNCLFLDNMSHPSTGGTLAAWSDVCDYLRSIRDQIRPTGMKLVVNLACQPYFIAGADSDLVATAVDGLNFEQPLHWDYCRLYPDRVQIELNQYRRWLDQGLHIALMAAHSEIVYDPPRREWEQRNLAAVCMMVRRPGDAIGVPRTYFEAPPDWSYWPAQFGAAQGDYQLTMPGPVLTRDFAHATISIDLSKSVDPVDAANAVTITTH